MQRDHEQIRDIYLQAFEIEDSEQRRHFLNGICGKDAELRLRVEEMLSIEAEADRFFTPLQAKSATITGLVAGQDETSGPQEGPGSTIGRYKLLEQIGEGGFGVVYMAEQVEPVRRKVALKIIKLGMDTREVIARFNAERQALALMDHPNVSRVFDAGATSSGRPFFVMELVKGLPITEFCDQHRLATRERIELFLAVCYAAQHAHSKGVIHRDLKPSNILVAMQDGRPVPKVIDFGIAKAVERPLTDQTLFTRFGQMLGTPVYMSPEHLCGGDVDTRSDIYSLGVILYELLSGRLPFDFQSLRKAGPMEIMRVVREEDPVPPSTRLIRLGGEIAEVALHRAVNPRRLTEMLRGELDWITLKTLQKDRSRRYETPLALADDLGRHLRNQPVLAGPPDLGYRCRKFIQRHKYSVAAAAGVFLSLLAGLVLATAGFLDAKKESRRAFRAEQEADQRGRLALTEADRARQKELSARQVSYASDMALASHSLEINNLGRVKSLLERHAEGSGPEDLRGWEWRYLWLQCQSSELFQLGAFSNAASSLAFSGDGNLVAASDTAGLISVWDLPARALIRSFKGRPALAISPESKLLVDGDGLMRDPESGAPLGRLAKGGEIKRLCFSRDGRLLAALVDAEGLCVWDVESRGLLWKASGYPAATLHYGALQFAPDGRMLAVGDQAGRLHLLEPRTGETIRVWTAQREGITSVAISTDSAVVASSSGYSHPEIRLWEASSGELRGTLNGHRAWVSSLSFSPETGLLASASADQSIGVWNIARLELVATLKGHLHEIWQMTFLPDGRTIFSGGKDGALKIWRVPAAPEAQGGREFSARDLKLMEAAPRDFAFGPNGELLGTDAEGWVTRWALPSLRALGRIEALGASNHLVACSAGGVLATVDAQNVLRLWDFQNQVPLTNFVVCSSGERVTWTGFAERGRLLATITDGRRVQIWDSDKWVRVASWDSGKRALSPVSLSPDGRFLAAGGEDALVCELRTGKEVARIAVHKLSADAVAFSPDSSLLATVSQDGLAKLWKTDTWQEVATLKGHMLGIHSVAFSPDGRRLATGSLGNESVKIWDLSTMQEVLNLKGHPDLTTWLTFSPEGRTLVALGRQSGLRCWSAPLLREIGNPALAPLE